MGNVITQKASRRSAQWLLGVLGMMIVIGGFNRLAAQSPADHLQPAKWSQSCFDCHRCDQPTAADPCLKRCPSSQVSNEGQIGCADMGPKIVMIAGLSDLYQPVEFTHRLHAEMSLMDQGCSQCHHYSSGSTTQPCRECHAVMPAKVSLNQPGLKGAYHRQCLDCHIEWSHSQGCETCHLPVDNSQLIVTPEEGGSVDREQSTVAAKTTISYQTTHAEAPIVSFHHKERSQDFGQECTGCHESEGCRECHDARRAASVGIDRTVTCFGCHQETNCTFCHSSSEREASHHGRIDSWQLKGYHRELPCSDCHGSASEFSTPSADCGQCHGDWGPDFTHAATGLVLNEDHSDIECENCHLEGDFARLPDCTTCHDDELAFPAQLPGSRMER